MENNKPLYDDDTLSIDARRSIYRLEHQTQHPESEVQKRIEKIISEDRENRENNKK